MKALLAAIVVLTCITPLFAWHTNTHLQMTRDAASLMPADLRQIFLEHQRHVESGIFDPDDLLRDWHNHYYIAALPEGGGLDRIDKLIAVIQEKLQKSKLTDAAKQFCYLAHYIGDLWTPEPFLKDAAGNSNFLLNHTVVVSWEGYEKQIENFHDYFQSRSTWRWKLENSPATATLLYSEAVNDIARAWLTLWQLSGRTVEPQPAAILEHKREALNVQPGRTTRSSRSTAWDNQWYSQNWRKYMSRSRRLDLQASVEIRNQKALLSRVHPSSPFTVLESSLKVFSDRSFFVIRVRAQMELVSIAILYPGFRGAAAINGAIAKGDVVKIEAVLPANAKKDLIEILFGTAETGK